MIKLRNRVLGKNQGFYLFIHLISISLTLSVRSQEVRHELDTVLTLEGPLARLRRHTHISAFAGNARQILGVGGRKLNF